VESKAQRAFTRNQRRPTASPTDHNKSATTNNNNNNNNTLLPPSDFFSQLVALETLDSAASYTLDFLCEAGRRLSAATGDVRETAFLFQILYIAIQRFNSLCCYLKHLQSSMVNRASSLSRRQHPVFRFVLTIWFFTP